MTLEQRQSIVTQLEGIRKELLHDEDSHTLRIVTSQIEQVLELEARYYALQLSTSATSTNSDLLPASSICYGNTMMTACSDKWDCLS